MSNVDFFAVGLYTYTDVMHKLCVIWAFCYLHEFQCLSPDHDQSYKYLSQTLWMAEKALCLKHYIIIYIL